MREANPQLSPEELERRKKIREAIKRHLLRSSNAYKFGRIPISKESRLRNGVIAPTTTTTTNDSPTTTNVSPSTDQSESTVDSAPVSGTESIPEDVPQQTPIPTRVKITPQEFVKISLKKFQTTSELKKGLIIKSTLIRLKRLYKRS
jgi:hypothetical protein